MMKLKFLEKFIKRSPPGAGAARSGVFPFLELPVELVCKIADVLAPDDKAALALTCHALLSIIGSAALKLDDYPPSYELRTAKSRLLRRLNRDRPDPSLYVCYKCIKFHSIESTTTKLRTYTPPDVGFPVCQSRYIEAMREVRHLIRSPPRQPAPKYWVGMITSPVKMEYAVETGTDRSHNDIFLRRAFVLYPKTGKYDWLFMLPSNFLKTSNLEICPHVYLGWDCTKGNGTFYDFLDDYYRRQHRDWSLAVSAGQAWQPEPFTGFICQDCCLEVNMRFQKHKVKIQVYQHVGPIKKNPLRLLFDVETWRTGGWRFQRRRPWINIVSFDRNRKLRPGDLKEEWERVPCDYTGQQLFE